MLWTLSFSVACLASCIIPVKMESEMMTSHFSSVRVSLNSTSMYGYQSTDPPRQTACSDTDDVENGTETQTNKTGCQMATIGSTAVYSPYWWQILQVKNWYKYGSPILIVVGTVGNFLSIVTLQSRLFKSSSTSFILSMLAVCEILLLYVGLLRNYIQTVFNVNIRNYSDFGCKFHVFLTYYSRQLASWTLIFLTAERTISVYFPFKCKQLCIVFGWMVVAALLAAADGQFFRRVGIVRTTYGIQSIECDIDPAWKWFITGPWYWIDTFLSDLIPFGVIIIGNALIIGKIVSAQRARLTQMQATSSDGKQEQSKPSPMSSTTYVLILVSFVFLVTHLPTDVFMLGQIYGLVKSDTDEHYYNNLVVYAIVTVIYYVNSAIEFVIYFSSGQKFRSAFLDMFGMRRAKQRYATTE